MARIIADLETLAIFAAAAGVSMVAVMTEHWSRSLFFATSFLNPRTWPKACWLGPGRGGAPPHPPFPEEKEPAAAEGNNSEVGEVVREFLSLVAAAASEPDRVRM